MDDDVRCLSLLLLFALLLLLLLSCLDRELDDLDRLERSSESLLGWGGRFLEVDSSMDGDYVMFMFA